MKAVLAFVPDAIVLGVDPTQLDCRNLLSEIKGCDRTHDIRVVNAISGRTARLWPTSGWLDCTKINGGKAHSSSIHRNLLAGEETEIFTSDESLAFYVIE